MQLGNEIVFAEVDTQGNVKECTGLAALYLLEQPSIPPLRIMDNHNHALYAWVTAYNKNNTPLTVVHIDQHADLGTTPLSFDLTQKNNEDYLRHYTNEVCTIASFIQPLVAVGIVHECIQVRTSTKLHEIHATQLQTPYILDIDLDFFALPQEPGAEEEQIMHIQTLLP